MPNWNTTLYVAVGDSRELQELADLLNWLFFKEPVNELHKTFFRNRKFVDEEITITER